MPMKKYGETILSRQLPNVRRNVVIPRGAFGAAAVVALDETATALTKHARKARDSMDSAAIMESLTEYRDQSEIIMKATGAEDDQEAGILTRQGYNAKGAYAESRDKLGSLADDLVAKAPERVRNRLTKRLRTKIESDTIRASNHEATEWRKYLASAAEGDIRSAARRALDNYDNPKVAEDEIANVIDTYNTNVDGKSISAVAANRDGAVSAIREGIAKRIMLEDPEAAMHYFNDHKDQILPHAQDPLKKEIQAESLRVEATQISDDLFERVQIGSMTEPEALAELKKVKGMQGKKRDEATKRFKLLVADQKGAEAYAYTEKMRGIKKGLNDIVPVGPGSVRKLTPDKATEVDRLIATARAEDEPMLRAYVNRLIYNDTPTAATDKAKAEWDDMPMEDKLSMSMEEFDDRYGLTMTDNDYKSTRLILTGIHAGNPQALNWNQRMTMFVNEIKKDLPGRTKAKKDQRVAIVKRLLNNEFDIRLKAKGAPLSTKEKEDILSDFSREGSTKLIDEGVSAWTNEYWMNKGWVGETDVPFWKVAMELQLDPDSDAGRWRDASMMRTIQNNPHAMRWLGSFRESFETTHKRQPNHVEIYVEFERWKNWVDRKRRMQESNAEGGAAQ